jgi:hypothetical protein
MRKSYITFRGKRYKKGEGWCAEGDTVWVHPTETSIAKEKYKATVVVRDGDLGTEIEGGHFSLMRDYLFDRLEKI